MGHDLHLQPAPAGQMRIIERRGMTRHHHLAGQGLEQDQQPDMIRFRHLEAVAAGRAAGGLQIGGIGIDQLGALEGEGREEIMGAAMHPFDRVVTAEGRQCPFVEIDADIAHRRRLAFHDRPAAEMALDIGRVRRHQRNQRLAQAGCCLRSEISHAVSPLTRARSIESGIY